MTRFVLILIVAMTLSGSLAQAGWGQACWRVAAHPLDFFSQLLSFPSSFVRNFAGIELQRAVEAGTFDNGTDVVYDNTVKRSDWFIAVHKPRIKAWMDKMGFTEYSASLGPAYNFFQVEVPFGKKKLYLQVQVGYYADVDHGDPIYIQDDRDGGVFTNRQGRPEERGSFFYGYRGNGGANLTPDHIEIKFLTDRTWGIAQAPGMTLPMETAPIIDQNHSYKAIEVRAQLALDLTRQMIGKYYKDGFDLIWRSYNDHIPAVDLGVTRGGMSLTDTDPIYLRNDQRGHYMIYIYNLVTAMNLTNSAYNLLRAATPVYVHPDFREGSDTHWAPKNGEPYKVHP